MLTIKNICMHKATLVFKDNFSSPGSPIPQMTELAYNQNKSYLMHSFSMWMKTAI